VLRAYLSSSEWWMGCMVFARALEKVYCGGVRLWGYDEA